MTPASSSFWMRRQHGVVDSPTSLPMSATERVQSCCRIRRILTSISSSMGAAASGRRWRARMTVGTFFRLSTRWLPMVVVVLRQDGARQRNFLMVSPTSPHPCPSPATPSRVHETDRSHRTHAAQLRSRLTGLLQEHVYLAAAVTGAIAGGRSDEVASASTALDGNSDALADNFEAIFAGTPDPDPTTAKQFPGLWKRHVGYVAAYAQGSSSAVSDLAQYARDFGMFINSLLPSLPAEASRTW